MKNITLLLLLTTSGIFAQATPKEPKLPRKVFSQTPVVVHDPARDKPVLVLFENQRSFAKDVKTVTDTLSAKNTHRVLTNADSIKRYSDSKFIRQVVIVSRKGKK